MALNTQTQIVRRKSSKRQLLLLVSLLAVAALVYLQQQNIRDWLKLRGYTPTVAVADLATQDTMTPYARKVFYVNHPALQGKVEFKQCKIGGEQTIVLGCYHGPQNGIYVLTVTDPRLEGVEQVTAAHELLHAAYDRLSSSERKDIDRQLRAYFNQELKDERVRRTVEAYRTLEPNDLTNEMHSIFGTEVANLPPALEKYYTKYFADRSKVVSFAAQYQAEFTSRQDAIKAADARLSALKAQIDELKADLANRAKDLDASSERLQDLRDSNVQAYNAGVPGFNAKVNAYNDEAATAKSLIEQYNALVNSRNSIVLEAKQLANEINSNVAPIDEK
jgi:hypothetical protein